MSLILKNLLFHFTVKLMEYIPCIIHCMRIIAFYIPFYYYLGVLFYYLWIFLSIFFETEGGYFCLYHLETFLAPLGEIQKGDFLINFDEEFSESRGQGGNQIAPQNNGHAADENGGHGVDNPVAPQNNGHAADENGGHGVDNPVGQRDDEVQYAGENPILQGLQRFHAVHGGPISPEFQQMVDNHEEYQRQQRALRDAARSNSDSNN